MPATPVAIVVEDDFFLCEALVDCLGKLGFEVGASASNVATGIHAVQTVRFDFALVDLDLKGEMAFPVLDALLTCGARFALATGAFEEDIPSRYLAVPRIIKPYDLNNLKAVIGAWFPDRQADWHVSAP